MICLVALSTYYMKENFPTFFNFFYSFWNFTVTFIYPSLGVHGKKSSCIECDVEVHGAGLQNSCTRDLCLLILEKVSEMHRITALEKEKNFIKTVS